MDVLPLSSLLERLLEGGSLGLEEAYRVAISMLRGDYDDIAKAALLVALRAKGESFQEIAGFAKALRDTCVKVDVGYDLLDTAGTGGDGYHTINVSTAAALVAASVGLRVAKHGNRSVSSRSGSADFLEKLGYTIDHGPKVAKCMIDRVGFTFLYAPRYHPAMKMVMHVRKRLGVRTIFNLVGPLANPAKASYQLLGVARRELLYAISGAAAMLGYKRVLVVHGHPGIDEVSVSGDTVVVEVRGGGVVEEYVISPEDLGLQRHSIGELRVNDPGESVDRVLRVFRGSGRKADRDFIAANAGLALYVAGYTSDPRDGVEEALRVIDEGQVYSYVEKMLEVHRECLSSRSVD